MGIAIDIEIEPTSSSVPKGYALVPVSQLADVVSVQKQQKDIEQKQIELISKENEIALTQKAMDIENQKKEMELTQQKKALAMEAQSLSERERNTLKIQKKTEQHIQTEIERKQKQSKRDRELEKQEKKRLSKQRREREDEEREDEERRRKRKRKKKKHKRKEDKGCTTAKCCRCLFKCSSLCLIVAILAGVVGCYFYFLSSKDENIYGFAAWAVAVIAFVFAFM